MTYNTCPATHKSPCHCKTINGVEFPTPVLKRWEDMALITRDLTSQVSPKEASMSSRLNPLSSAKTQEGHTGSGNSR